MLWFATSLEDAAADAYGVALELEHIKPSFKGELKALAKKHAKRSKRVQRIRRERMNEMVLQPLEGVDSKQYIPDVELGEDTLEKLIELEDNIARFYIDAAEYGANVLHGIDRTFKKFAKESNSAASSLKR